MPRYCEVVVNRPIIRHPVMSGRDYPEESSLLPQPGPESGADPQPPRSPAVANPWYVTFSYAIPEELRHQVALGQLVEVPFRAGSLQGVIIGLSETPPPDIDIRPLISILDLTPALSPTQIKLARWLSARYLGPISSCIWLCLPPGISRPPQTVVEAAQDKKPPTDLDARAYAMFLYLQKRGEPIPADDLEAGPLAMLRDIQLVRTWQRLAPPRIGPQIDRTVELIATPEEVAAVLPTLGRPSKEADVLLYLAYLEDPLPFVDQVKDAVGCTINHIHTLAERGWVNLAPRRNLVTTTLSGRALDQALTSLGRAPAQRAALAYLRDHPGPVDAGELVASAPVLAALEARGYLQRWTEPATVALTLDQDELLDAVLELKGTTRYATVLDLLAQEEGRVWIGWVYAQTDATLDTLRDLAEAGLVAFDEARRWRDPLADQSFVLEQPPRLTPEQEVAWGVIRKSMRRPHNEAARHQFLLHGVTGSGKTEIYLRAVEEALQQGRGAIVLVPEIALAAQTVRRVVARFPGKVAVWHSDLSLGERFDTWQRVRSGELQIVVGARSALFAPVADLGLIVVDEEHEPAYKENRAPRYHAREAALQLGRLAGATVILGSATPDVSTFRQAERGDLTLLTLPKRVLAHRQHLSIQLKAVPTHLSSQVAHSLKGETDELHSLPLPPVQVVDLREELKAGNRSIFSHALQHAIRETLAADQQVLLFLNRRGTATFVLCRDCGHVMRCPRCEVPLTYHEGEEALICHHCNRRHPDPDRCPVCDSTRIRYFGLGTERVEAAIREMFPDAHPLRWDLDTARGRGSHAAFFQQLIDGRANLLVGTQMIAKGLDLPRLTLVGIISADTALYLPDFRAAERTFQLLTQVAGRAGRSPLGGRVILQTYNPDLPVIRAAAAHDYAAFYRDELIARRDGRYPPFKRLARLVFTGSGAERAQREAEGMARALQTYIARQGAPGVEIVGPAPCFYRRLRGQHRWHIVIRAKEPEDLLRPFRLPLGWRVDVDPVDFL